MKKYYCKNGEVVFVEPYDKDNIVVFYNNQKYKRSKKIINNTIFEQNPLRVKIGNTVYLKNTKDLSVLVVMMCATEVAIRYKRSGGAYYGNSVEVTETGVNVGEISDSGVISISCESPLGKAIVGKTIDDIVAFETPEKIIEEYKIIHIC